MPKVGATYRGLRLRKRSKGNVRHRNRLEPLRRAAANHPGEIDKPQLALIPKNASLGQSRRVVSFKAYEFGGTKWAVYRKLPVRFGATRTALGFALSR